MSNELEYNHATAQLLAEKDAEIARLKAGGCARDQTTTQFCAEAVALQQRIAELEAEVQNHEDKVAEHAAFIKLQESLLHDKDQRIKELEGLRDAAVFEALQQLNEVAKLTTKNKAMAALLPWQPQQRAQTVGGLHRDQFECPACAWAKLREGK